jgi:hypothetical protein
MRYSLLYNDSEENSLHGVPRNQFCSGRGVVTVQAGVVHGICRGGFTGTGGGSSNRIRRGNGRICRCTRFVRHNVVAVTGVGVIEPLLPPIRPIRVLQHITFSNSNATIQQNKSDDEPVTAANASATSRDAVINRSRANNDTSVATRYWNTSSGNK